MKAIKGNIFSDVVACFEEPNETGDVLDFNAPRNVPLGDPAGHLDKIAWHSELYQYEVAIGPVDVPVSHPFMATTFSRLGVYSSSFYPFVYIDVWGNSGATEHVLVNHNLGYPPVAFVILDGRMVLPGTVVQAESGNRSRFIEVYVDENVVGIREMRVTSSLTVVADLPAVSRTYRVVVCRESSADADLPLFGKVSGEIVLARGKISTGKRYARVTVSGETGYVLDRARAMDIRNGSIRTTSGGNIVSEGRYNGSYAGGDYLPIGFF